VPLLELLGRVVAGEAVTWDAEAGQLVDVDMYPRSSQVTLRATALLPSPAVIRAQVADRLLLDEP
jgi:hypothetical protein